MTVSLYALAAGLAAGSIHVAAGPDHLAALAPLGAARGARAWRLGALWALGHGAGVAALGALALLVRGQVELAALSAWSEKLVGLSLIGVGLWGLRRALSPWLHAHTHRHGSQVHTHVHWHAPRRPDGPAHRHAHVSTAIGALHGLAGGSHLLALLPTLALPSTAAGIAYLVGYGAGTLLAMTLFAGLVGRLARGGGLAGGRALLGSCSAAAVIVGVLWVAA